MKIKPGICKRCKEYATNTNNCLCREYLVWIDWLDDVDGDTIYAHDAQDAAEKYAKQYDEGGDCPIINTGSSNVTVKSVDTLDELQFYIEAWPEPTYSASQIEQET